MTFEGIDGSGKSTQARLLAEALAADGRDVVATREPGGTEAGERIRELILSGPEIAPWTEAALFAAARAQLVEEVIAPGLARGADVICDRYLDSSLAYQGIARGLGVERVLELNVHAIRGILPDRTFLLGGPASNGSAIDFGRHAVSLLRGFPTDTFAGSRVALVNADYRWPIARPQRGVGTWPLLFHTVHAAVFADAGHAWTHAFHADAIKVSAGGELSANVVAGYFIPLTATVGAAWGHDGSGLVRDGATVYFRVGRAF